MNIIEKIKDSVESATGQEMHYQAVGALNEIFDNAEFPSSYAFLLDSAAVTDRNGQFHEQVTLGVFFVDVTDYDFNAMENETKIIQKCMETAFSWLVYLRRSHDLKLVSINNSQRVYDTFDVNVTGYGVNVTIEDTEGFGICDTTTR